MQFFVLPVKYRKPTETAVGFRWVEYLHLGSAEADKVSALFGPVEFPEPGRS